MESLSACGQLTTLGLCAPVTPRGMQQILARLPMLHTLSLVECSEIDRLHFFSDLPQVMRTLRSLSLDHCRRVWTRRSSFTCFGCNRSPPLGCRNRSRNRWIAWPFVCSLYPPSFCPNSPERTLTDQRPPADRRLRRPFAFPRGLLRAALFARSSLSDLFLFFCDRPLSLALPLST